MLVNPEQLKKHLRHLELGSPELLRQRVMQIRAAKHRIRILEREKLVSSVNA